MYKFKHNSGTPYSISTKLGTRITYNLKKQYGGKTALHPQGLGIRKRKTCKNNKIKKMTDISVEAIVIVVTKLIGDSHNAI